MRIVVFVILFISTSLLASENLYQADSDTKSKGMSLGVKLMRMEYEKEKETDRGTVTEKEEFFAGVVPVTEYISQIGGFDGLFVYSNSNLTWGLDDFFFDFGIGAGLRYYPFNNPLISIYGGGEAGTFFFNNATLTARAGADIDFKMNNDTSSFLGGEYFYRKSYRLIEYIEEDHWFISSPGWAINGGFRVKMDIFKDGIQGIPKTL